MVFKQLIDSLILKLKFAAYLVNKFIKHGEGTQMFHNVPESRITRITEISICPKTIHKVWGGDSKENDQPPNRDEQPPVVAARQNPNRNDEPLAATSQSPSHGVTTYLLHEDPQQATIHHAID